MKFWKKSCWNTLAICAILLLAVCAFVTVYGSIIVLWVLYDSMIAPVSNNMLIITSLGAILISAAVTLFTINTILKLVEKGGKK